MVISATCAALASFWMDTLKYKSYSHNRYTHTAGEWLPGARKVRTVTEECQACGSQQKIVPTCPWTLQTSRLPVPRSEFWVEQQMCSVYC